MAGAARQWTREERDRLFDDYFGRAPGICPVCAHEVGMIMSYLARTVTLSLSCQGCGNKASVSGVPPLDGLLHSTGSTRVSRITEEDESQWG